MRRFVTRTQPGMQKRPGANQLTKLPRELYKISEERYPYIEETRKFVKDIVLLTRVVKKGTKGGDVALFKDGLEVPFGCEIMGIKYVI